ncbi:hypothetical protein C5167_005806 [Papaver somniferum]|uniref:Serine aminopeptidase S33 domain-containing protein n=1 Tax=Papaver somniferum TaxID=3469 RepID=A0A4Y7JFD4_PAPSO|nr:hypothetical protein C5167_005806 [Papaver somniferum]
MLLMAFSSAKLSRTCRNSVGFRVYGSGFPSFLPKEVEKIKDPYAIKLAQRIERLPVKISFSDNSILSSCVKPSVQKEKHPLVLLHGFDSYCLEWRYTYPVLEEAGMETWAVDILGWGFSDLSILPPCDVTAKREHLFQLWKSYIRRPMVLVGPSLGAAVAIDFALNHPEAIKKEILIIWGVNDQIVSNKLAMRLNTELQNSTLHQIPNAGHLPHVEKPDSISELIVNFVQEGKITEKESVYNL